MQQAQEATGLEKLVLGAIMSRPGSLEELMQEVKLAPEMFYNTAHQTIFNAILNNNPYDLWTITQYLIDKGKLEEIGGAVPLAELVKYGSTNGETIHHAKVIVDKFITRQTWEILQKAAETCQSPDDITDIIAKLTDLIPSDTTFFESEKKFKVDFTSEPLPAPAIIYLKNKDRLVPSFTLQNFSLIIGKAKSRKTFLTVLIAASYLGYKNDLIIADPERKGIVLVIDTEQSNYHLHKMMKRICTMIGEDNPERLQAYGLKTLTPSEKIKFIEYKIQTTPELKFMVIDGIRDLVYDINSPEEATKTSVLLMKWCALNNIHILNILHQNKGDANARGHLGSELTNKAETVLSVNLTPDKTITTVEAEYSREMDFDTFSFIINEDSLPEICFTPEKESETKSNKPQFMEDQRHFQATDSIYKNNLKLSYAELQDAIIVAFDNTFGRSICRTFIAYYLKKEWILKAQDGHKVFYIYNRATF